MTTVCIDLGHGGSDSGAVQGKHVEKNYNLDAGLSCGAELKRHGVNVCYTRTTDVYLSLSARANYANNKGADLFISFHHNRGGGDRGELIYSVNGGKGKTLSSFIAKEMKAYGQSTVKEYSRAGKSGTDYYAVIRQTKMPAIIVELAFLDNANDVKIVDTLEKRQKYGIAIAHGILKYLGIAIKSDDSTSKPDTKPTTPPPTVDNKPADVKPDDALYMIAYDGEVDKTIAEVLTWELGADKCLLVESANFKPGKNIKKTYAIGKACNSVKADYSFQGKNRNETLKLVQDYMNTL